MRKFAEFMDKVMADEAAKAEFGAVIGARKERELSDDDFQKIVELSEKLGAAVTLDEVKDFFAGDVRELSEEELAGVAGGAGGGTMEKSKTFFCPLCGEKIAFVTVTFSMGQAMDTDIRKEGLQSLTVNHLRNAHCDIVDKKGRAEMIAEEMIEHLMGWKQFIREGENATRPIRL